MVETVNSMIQWEPENIVVASSSVYVRYIYVLMLWHNSYLATCSLMYICSVIESFEGVTAVFAQQLPLNEKQNFTTLSVTLVTELVKYTVI